MQNPYIPEEHDHRYYNLEEIERLLSVCAESQSFSNNPELGHDDVSKSTLKKMNEIVKFHLDSRASRHAIRIT